MATGATQPKRLEPLCELSYDFITQFIFSKGKFCKLYSRCSCCIIHTVRFFCIISSSLSLRVRNQFLYHCSSQLHNSGLSGTEEVLTGMGRLEGTYPLCRPLGECPRWAPSRLQRRASVCCSASLTSRGSSGFRMLVLLGFGC
jgi:hypothetical protein